MANAHVKKHDFLVTFAFSANWIILDLIGKSFDWLLKKQEPFSENPVSEIWIGIDQIIIQYLKQSWFWAKQLHIPAAWWW